MRLQQSRSALFSESTAQKRPAEANDGLDDAKRQRMMGMTRKYPPMPPPPNSFLHLFTLTDDSSLQQFDVTLLPADIVSTVSTVLLQHVDANALNDAIEAIRQRYTHLQKMSSSARVSDVPLLGPTGIDDEDDYDPEVAAGSDHMLAQTTEKALEELAAPAIELGPFEFPKPPPLTEVEVTALSDQTVGHVFQLVASLDAVSQPHAKQNLGLNRIAASTNDRDSWATILIRLATRAPSGLSDLADALSEDEMEIASARLIKQEALDEPRNVANSIRQTLFMYVLEDFRPRLNMAISWLTEEWYADKLIAKVHPELRHLPNYTRWVNRLVDRLLPYLDARDKNVLIRFLSEIPTIDREILDRVKTLARDPERVSMCILAMQYLLMMRPPVREVVLDTVESVWHEGDEQVKTATLKVLNKWRPGFLERAIKSQKEEKEEEVVKDEQAAEETKTNMNGIHEPPPPLQMEVVNADPRRRNQAAAAATG